MMKKLSSILLMVLIALVGFSQVEPDEYQQGGFCTLNGQFYPVERGGKRKVKNYEIRRSISDDNLLNFKEAKKLQEQISPQILYKNQNNLNN